MQGGFAAIVRLRQDLFTCSKLRPCSGKNLLRYAASTACGGGIIFSSC